MVESPVELAAQYHSFYGRVDSSAAACAIAEDYHKVRPTKQSLDGSPRKENEL
jgi:hypothetical protein